MKTLIISILFLVFSISTCAAQLCVRTTLNDEILWTWISVNETYPYLTSNENEKLCVEMRQKLNKIFILNEISIEIINIPGNVKSDLGNIEIPMRKIVTTDMERFSDEEKKMIIPIHHYNQLLGYEYLNQLENPKIIFTCNDEKYELDKFEFDIEKQKVVIDWENLKFCTN